MKVIVILHHVLESYHYLEHLSIIVRDDHELLGTALSYMRLLFTCIRALRLVRTSLLRSQVSSRMTLGYVQSKLLKKETKGTSSSQVSSLQRFPYYSGRGCMRFGVFRTKRKVRNRQVDPQRYGLYEVCRYLQDQVEISQ